MSKAEEDRKERLAQALRANLRRRKAQARAGQDEQGKGGDEFPPEDQSGAQA